MSPDDAMVIVLKDILLCLLGFTQCALPLSAGGEGVEPPTKFPKRGGLTRPQLFEGGCWERGASLFSGWGGGVAIST